MTRYGLIFLLYGLIVSVVGSGLSIAAILFVTFILSLPAAFVVRLTAEGRL